MLFPEKQLVVVVVGHCVAVVVAVVVVVGIGVSAAAGSLLKATQLIDRSGQASEHRLPHIRVKYLRALRRYKCICVCSSFSGFLFVVCHCCYCWAPSGPPFDVTGQLRRRCVLIASTLKTLFAFTAAKLVRSFRFRLRSSGRRVFVAFRNCSKMS